MVIKLGLAQILMILNAASLSCVGCGRHNTAQVPPSVIDSDIQPYVDLFHADMNLHGIHSEILTSVVFGTVESVSSISGALDSVGVCESGPSINQVTLARSNWDKVSDQQKKFLVYHELGHCVLNRVHKPDTTPYFFCSTDALLPENMCPMGAWAGIDRPVSIMYPSDVSDLDVSISQDGYAEQLVTELFEGGN